MSRVNKNIFLSIFCIIFCLMSCSLFSISINQSDNNSTQLSRNPSSVESIEIHGQQVDDSPVSVDHETQILKHESRAKKAVLVVHGLHESPYYMKSFASFMYDKGYDVVNLRLPGHLSKNRENINYVKSADWINAVNNAFNELKKQGYGQIDYLGYSLGGTLGVYLKLKYPQQIQNLILIAPALALSDKVFLSTMVLGWTKLDSFKLCEQQEEKFWCKYLLASDEQLQVLYKEGIVASPAAGFQVQQVIETMLSEFGSHRSDNSLPIEAKQRMYYEDLLEMYSQLTGHVIMVNSESDEVVHPDFNIKLAKKLGSRAHNYVISSEYKVSHVQINLNTSDALKKSPQVYNNQFLNLQNFITSNLN